MLSSSLNHNQVIVKMADKIKNAASRNLPFTLTVKDVQKIMSVDVCQYSGQEFISVSDMTFERINPMKGYVKGNVIMVNSHHNTRRCHLDNFMKLEDVDNATKLKMLEYATKAMREVVDAEARVAQETLHALQLERAQKELASQCRARGLAHMATEMKRSRFRQDNSK